MYIYIYIYIYINSSSTRVKLDGKTLLWRGLSSKRLTIWSPKAGYSTVSNCTKIPTMSLILMRNQGNLKSEIDSLSEVKIHWCIFHGDALSPLQFVMAMLPLNHILWKCTARYKLSKSQENIKYLMDMDNIKLFANTKKRIGNPKARSENIQSIYRNGIWHGKMHLGSKEKQQTTHYRRNRITKSRKDQNVRRKGKVQIVVNTGSGHHQISGDERKNYKRETRKLITTKLYSRNLIKMINTWAVLLIRYLGPFLKCTREELKQMDQRTRKLMTMYKDLHLRDDVDRLYVSRKERRRRIASNKDSVDA